MLDFIHLRPINGQEIGGIFSTSNRYACRAHSFFEDRYSERHGIETETRLIEELDGVQQDPAFAVEYENCQHRLSCGIDDENDKDDGQDSTFCLSNYNEKNNRVNQHERYASNNRAMSHCAGKNFKLNSEYNRAAFSQYNFDDKEEDHYDPDDEEDEIMMQLEDMQDTGAKLNLNKRQKSLVVGNQKNGEEKLLMSQ